MSEARSLSVQRLGPYELLERLGHGGMAEVYVARRAGPHGFSKRFAIKRMLPQIAEDSRFVGMFCDEARICAAMNHPNIVQVVDFGEHQSQLFMAMEFVDGLSCAKLLRSVAARRGRFPVPIALFITLEVLKGLDYAHSATDDQGRALNIVHRDVSPGNILIGRSGEVKLTDFGIVLSSFIDRRTYPGELKGKIGYMSPEQVVGDDLDPRSDLFTLAIVLAEMLLTRPLFPGRDELEVLTAIHNADLAVLERHGGDVPEPLLGILRTALARRPDQRFQTARDFAIALQRCAVEHGYELNEAHLVSWLGGLGILPSRSGTRRRVPSPPAASEAAPVPVAPPRPEPVGKATRPTATPPEPPRGRAPSLIPGRSIREVGEVGTDVGRVTPRVREPSNLPRHARGVLREPTPPELGARVDDGQPSVQPPARAEGGAAAIPPDGSRRRPRLAVVHDERRYWLRLHRGGDVGPVDLPKVLELVATGRLPLATQVSRDGTSYRPIVHETPIASLALRAPYRLRQSLLRGADERSPLTSMALAALCSRVAREGLTGVVVLQAAHRFKHLYFARGELRFVVSSERRELLGARLFASGLLCREDVELGLLHAERNGQRLGQALVAGGALRPSELLKALAEQVEERFLDAFSWDGGELAFVPGVEAGDDQLECRTKVAELIVRGVRERVPGAVVEQHVSAHGGTLRPAREAPALTALGLSEVERRVLQLATGMPSAAAAVETLAREGVVDPTTARVVLFVALAGGWLATDAG